MRVGRWVAAHDDKHRGLAAAYGGDDAAVGVHGLVPRALPPPREGDHGEGDHGDGVSLSPRLHAGTLPTTSDTDASSASGSETEGADTRGHWFVMGGSAFVPYGADDNAALHRAEAAGDTQVVLRAGSAVVDLRRRVELGLDGTTTRPIMRASWFWEVAPAFWQPVDPRLAGALDDREGFVAGGHAAPVNAKDAEETVSLGGGMDLIVTGRGTSTERLALRDGQGKRSRVSRRFEFAMFPRREMSL